jgi:hypothetical protein
MNRHFGQITAKWRPWTTRMAKVKIESNRQFGHPCSWTNMIAPGPPNMAINGSNPPFQTPPLMTGNQWEETPPAMRLNTPSNDRSSLGLNTPSDDRSKPVIAGIKHPQQWPVISGSKPPPPIDDQSSMGVNNSHWWPVINGGVYSHWLPVINGGVTPIDYRSSMGGLLPLMTGHRWGCLGGLTPIKDQSKPVLDGSLSPHSWPVS